MLVMASFNREDQIAVQSTYPIRARLERLIIEANLSGLTWRGKRLNQKIAVNAIFLGISQMPEAERNRLLADWLDLLDSEIDPDDAAPPPVPGVNRARSIPPEELPERLKPKSRKKKEG